jgi:2'-5' RNA ligase
MLKSQLTCSHCSKIYKDPILLPCDDTICRQHLYERDVVKANRIKCNKCNEEFGVRDNEFKSNETLANLIESQCYLRAEEISLKKDLEESIRQFFEFYEEFQQNKSKLVHRERIKERIDHIALAMVDQTKESEATYLKSLKEHFSSFDDGKSLQIKLTEIEDIFRNPNLLIETIREMEQKQHESLNEIQSKLNQINRVKEFCEETNTFQPNSILLNQIETSSLFGLLKLNQYSNINSLKSQILNGEQQLSELIKLCEFSPNDKWSLLYRATRDGFGSSDFHSRCNGRANTLTIFKAKGSGFIFGGFSSVEWEPYARGGYKSDPNAFIFSLTNGENKPVKIKIDPNRHEYAIRCDSEWGPTFGRDIRIFNNANTTMDSHSDLGSSYIHPQYEFGTNEACTFLAGSHKFKLNEIEVYVRE